MPLKEMKDRIALHLHALLAPGIINSLMVVIPSVRRHRADYPITRLRLPSLTRSPIGAQTIKRRPSHKHQQRLNARARRRIKLRPRRRPNRLLRQAGPDPLGSTRKLRHRLPHRGEVTSPVVRSFNPSTSTTTRAKLCRCASACSACDIVMTIHQVNL
jgi:hypothetical protein